MLIDGVCPTCPVQAPAAAHQPPKPAPAARPASPAAVAVAKSVPAAPRATAVPHQPAQPAEHREYFSSVPTPPVAKRGMGWRYHDMWNWGAFLLCPLWLMNHGRIGRAIVFLALSAVPFLWVFALGMAIAYGIKGNKVASMSRDFVDDAQFVAVQNAWRNAGFGVALVALLLALLAGYANEMSAPQRGS